MKLIVSVFFSLIFVSCNTSNTMQQPMNSSIFKMPSWAKSANVYEVNLRQYTNNGTFSAFEKELPRLKEMGVEILWFMPITPISIEKRKGSLGSYYACSDYVSTNPEYGSLDDFKLLVKSAHNLGMKVIIDWVANHTGADHTWTKSNPNFFKKDSSGKFYDVNGWEDVIDLDFNSKEMRQEMIKAMHFWVANTNIDGFRCDMAHLVPLDFWKEARTSFDNENLFWLAETENPEYHQAFDVTYTWEWMHATEDFYKGKKTMNDLKNILVKYDTAYSKDAVRLFFTSNHDENSWNGTEYEKYGDASKALAVFSLLYKGIPMIYSGQEMPNKKRLKFFDKDVIEWNGKYELHDFYKTILKLRKSNAALNTDAILVHVNTGIDNVLAFKRISGKNEVLVLLNLSSTNHLRFSIPSSEVNGIFYNAFSKVENKFEKDTQFEMQAWEYLVYYK